MILVTIFNQQVAEKHIRPSVADKQILVVLYHKEKCEILQFGGTAGWPIKMLY